MTETQLHTAQAFGAGVLAIVGLAVIPTATLAKIGEAVAWLLTSAVSNAQSIAGAIGLLSAALLGAWTAWRTARHSTRADAVRRSTSTPPRREP